MARVKRRTERACEYCSKTFMPKGQLKKLTRYCCRECYTLSRFGTVEERFWAKVDKAGPNGCWLWLGTCGEYGHGQVSIGNSRRTATSRVSWELHHGKIPTGMVVCHKCDNPPCVNPAHLFLGTLKDNSEDCVRKGRIARSHAKLSHEQKAEVKRMLIEGITNRIIAESLGIHRKTVRYYQKQLEETCVAGGAVSE